MVRTTWSMVLVLGACTVTDVDRGDARSFDLEPDVGSSSDTGMPTGSEESGFGPGTDEEDACCYEIDVGNECCWEDIDGEEHCEPAYDKAKDCVTATGLSCYRVGCMLHEYPECCDPEIGGHCWGSVPGQIHWQWCVRGDDHHCDVTYTDCDDLGVGG